MAFFQFLRTATRWTARRVGVEWRRMRSPWFAWAMGGIWLATGTAAREQAGMRTAPAFLVSAAEAALWVKFWPAMMVYSTIVGVAHLAPFAIQLYSQMRGRREYLTSRFSQPIIDTPELRASRTRAFREIQRAAMDARQFLGMEAAFFARRWL